MMAENVDLRDDAVADGYLVKLNGHVWGIALGLLCGLGLFAATVILVLKGGDDVGQHLGLLGHFFYGYDVTWFGAFVGAVWGTAVGYLVGRIVCAVYNVTARK